MKLGETIPKYTQLNILISLFEHDEKFIKPGYFYCKLESAKYNSELKKDRVLTMF